MKSYKISDFERLDYDDVNDIPNNMGNYIWLLKAECELPTNAKMSHNPIFKSLKWKSRNYRVAYTGKATDLYKRLVKNHLNGNAGQSTLRKTIGSLMGFSPINRTAGKNDGKTKFSPSDEAKISQWLVENMIVIYYPNDNIEEVESDLIHDYDPPLNIDQNIMQNNPEYVIELKKLRARPAGASKIKSSISADNQSPMHFIIQSILDGTLKIIQKPEFWFTLFILILMFYTGLKL